MTGKLSASASIPTFALTAAKRRYGGGFCPACGGIVSCRLSAEYSVAPSMSSPKPGYEHWSDRDLLTVLRREKDEAAATELVNRYRTQVYGRCLLITRNRGDALDLTQEVFEKFFRYVYGKAPYRSFPYLLHQYSHDLYVDRMRRKSRYVRAITYWWQRHHVTESDFVTNGGRLRDTLADVDQREEVKVAMSRLVRLQRQCLERFYFRQLSYEEIAEELDITTQKVKSALQNGKRQLRLYFDRKENNG